MKSFFAALILATLVTLPVLTTVSRSADDSQRIVDNVYQLTDQDFDENIKQGVVLVDFWATWCGPCRTQGPIVSEIAQEIGQKAKIAKVDVDKARITANRFNIRYIPTIIIFKDGEPALRLEGLQDKDGLLQSIDAVILQTP